MTRLKPLIAIGLIAVWFCWSPTRGSAQSDAAPAEQEPTSDADEPAAGDEARDVASRRFRRAVELFQETDYRAALIEFQRAYETLPDYRLHYNIGQTKVQLQDYVGAQEAYQRYLSEGGDSVPGDRRLEVTRQLALMKERVARLSITANETGARVFIDDELTGVTPFSEPISVNVGRHRIVAKGKDGGEATQIVDVAGGDLVQVRLSIEEAEARTIVVEKETVVEPKRSSARKFALAGMIAGGGLVAGAAVSAGISAGAQNDFDSAIDDGNIGAARNQQSKTENAALATDILGATGIALLAAGIITWFVADDTEEPAESDGSSSVGWGIGPGSVLVRGSF